MQALAIIRAYTIDKFVVFAILNSPLCLAENVSSAWQLRQLFLRSITWYYPSIKDTLNCCMSCFMPHVDCDTSPVFILTFLCPNYFIQIDKRDSKKSVLFLWYDNRNCNAGNGLVQLQEKLCAYFIRSDSPA